MTELATPSTYFDIDNMRSYATEKKLIQVLNDIATPGEIRQMLVVCNRKGRFTVIVPARACEGNLTRFPGFMKIG